MRSIADGVPWKELTGADHPAAAWLQARLEASGLDAGSWSFSLPRHGDEVQPSPGQGTNVLARLPGSDWPDQVILVSCRGLASTRKHAGKRQRESSALAAMMQMAHGLAALQATGWQPRRTIVLAAWDPEDGGRAGSRAWLERGPMQSGRTTVAFVSADHVLSGPRWVVGTAPDLRSFMAGWLPAESALIPPGGRGSAGPYLARGVTTVELNRPWAGRRPGRRQREAAVEAAARHWGLLVLRLADAARVPVNPAVLAQQGLAGMQEVQEKAALAFDDNPPPLQDLRRAFLRMRRAGEEWNLAWGKLLHLYDTLPRQDTSGPAHQSVMRAQRQLMAALAHLTRSAEPAASCVNLLYCPDPAGEDDALFLPTLAAATATGDRSALIAEVLTLTSTVSRVTEGLATATANMTAPIPESP